VRNPVEKIISGGQTGADRAGLDVALELGLAIGGWVPQGRRAEDGVVPARYTGLRETDSAAYEERTERNVREADATVVFCFGAPTGGTALTVRLAERLGRPHLVVDLERWGEETAVPELRRWLAQVRPTVLNVAGPRASGEPRIADATRAVLRAALRPVDD
jgi:hypothetical protein